MAEKVETRQEKEERNTSSSSDISSSPHQLTSPTTDDRPIPPASETQWDDTTSPTGTSGLGPVKGQGDCNVTDYDNKSQPHDSHPVTDDRQPTISTATCTTTRSTIINPAGTTTSTSKSIDTTNHVIIKDDEREQLQDIKKSPLVPMKTSPSSTDNMTDRPTYSRNVTELSVMAERVEIRQEKKERKERERQEKERERLEKKRKKQKKEQQPEKGMKKRGRNTSSASDISSPPHQLTSPTTDDDKPILPGSAWASIGGLGPIKAGYEPIIKQPHDSYPVTDDRQPTVISTAEREQLQAIKKSPLVPMKTSPSSTDNTLMTEYNDEPTRAGATNITISPHVDQSMMMTGNYDRLEPHTDKVPSGSVTSRPVTGPIHGHHLHPPHDDTASPQSLPDISSINTRLAIAEVERDEYKKEIEKRERELKQRQEEIVQLKVEMRKIQSNSPQTHPQSSHLINEKMREELEQKMREELAAKEQKMREELAAKEQKMREKLTAKLNEEHVKEKEALLSTINDQSNTIKQLEEDYEKVIGEMSHKEMELQDQRDLLEEKCQTIKSLVEKMEEQPNTIIVLKEQVVKAAGRHVSDVSDKKETQATLEEVSEKLQFAHIQLQGYIETERKDREEMKSKLDDSQSQILALQQSLKDETHKTEELEAKNCSLQETVQQQKNELSVKDDAAKDWEEEKHMLTTQVNSYARQGDELKKSLTEQTDKCKSLEDQLMKKTEIESELQRAVEMEIADKQQLEQFIALERARLENKITRVNDTNKTLMEEIEKQRADNAMTEEHLRTSQQQLQEKTSEYDRLKEDYDSLTKLYQTWKVDRDEIDMTNEELGSGGWAEVNVAYFRRTRVAAKCLHKMIISDFNKSVFIREINIAATIRHPNLVQFIGATLVGSPIILSELMPTSLRKELDRGQLTQPQVIKISSDICCALNYLHQFQPSAIIHRDVSDANVLLEPSGGAGEWKAKVSDYGSANLIQQISTTSIMPGAFSYAAPEAKFPENHSPAMDVYSFGILVMVMILHKPPSTTVGERETQSSTIKWPPMRSLVQKCINRDHQRRPSIGDVHQLITKSL